MKRSAILLLGMLVLSGCATSSISDTGYSSPQESLRNSNYYIESGTRELDEQAVLGVAEVGNIDEALIRKSLKKSENVSIPKGSSILLIQSGAEYPDNEIVQAMSQFWDVNILSGDSRDYDKKGLHHKLRYMAATAGNRHVVVMWGIVETAEQKLATKNISWVPLVGWSLPDEQTKIRIGLKIAIIDVETGNWRMFNPKSQEDEFFSSIMNRAGEDQEKVIDLKKVVYHQSAKELYEKFTK